MRCLGEVPFRAWFAEATLEDIGDGTVCIGVPNRAVRKRLLEQYQAEIQAAFRVKHVEILVRGDRGPAIDAATPGNRPGVSRATS
jgi:chromosomal replication initiation ATPase DnaA